MTSTETVSEILNERVRETGRTAVLRVNVFTVNVTFRWCLGRPMLTADGKVKMTIDRKKAFS